MLEVAAAVWCSWVCTAAFFRRIDARRVTGSKIASTPAVFSASPSAPEKGVERGDQRYPAQIGDAIASQRRPGFRRGSFVACLNPWRSHARNRDKPAMSNEGEAILSEAN